jgi:hypothetical protein
MAALVVTAQVSRSAQTQEIAPWSNVPLATKKICKTAYSSWAKPAATKEKLLRAQTPIIIIRLVATAVGLQTHTTRSPDICF